MLTDVITGGRTSLEKEESVRVDKGTGIDEEVVSGCSGSLELTGVITDLVDTASTATDEVEMLINEVVGSAGSGAAVDKGMSGRVDIDSGLSEEDVLG